MKRLLLTILLFAPFALAGQEFLWDTNLDTRFDNREYAQTESGISQTLFSTKLTPSIGLGWGEQNSIKLGVDLWLDMGAEFGSINPELSFYYDYNSPLYKAKAGIVPRSSMLGDYSRAFFSDSLSYYDSNVSGLLLQYVAENLYVELALDWLGRESETTREKFMVISSARYNQKMFFLGYNFNMFHFAGSKTERGVVDNILAQVYLGVDLAEISKMGELSFSASWINALQNDRKYVGEFVAPAGFELRANLEKFNVGIDNTFYMGENLMPYYERYGAELYPGDIFYSTSSIYNRLEVYWKAVRHKNISLKVSSIHHFDGENWGSQQMAKLIVNFGKGDLKKKKAEISE
ncbi:MAG: hypothetical protein R3Y38_06335 [Rikenellaceae bacterium]